MGETIIPDTQSSNEGIKINFRNIFTFLSSLDYLKSIETSHALDSIDSKKLFFTGEKQALLMFIYTHTSFWVFLTYILLLLTAQTVFDIPPKYGIILMGTIWLLFGFWFVNRYTWGNGYLWEVVRSFMLNITFASILLSIATDFLVLYVIPFAYKMLVDWFNNSPKDGLLNAFAESTIIWIQSIFHPVIEKTTTDIKRFLPAYISISSIKIFSFLIPTMYMFYLHYKRKDLRERLNNLLKDIS